jgi:hypothetical protein
MKETYGIGDRIIVVDEGACYDSFEQWVNVNAPEHRAIWDRWAIPMKGNEYEIVALAEHGLGDVIIYGIKDRNSTSFFVIGRDGIRHII